MSRLRVSMVLCVLALGASAAGCGSDDDDDSTTEASSDSTQLAAVKGYLTDHSAELNKHVAALQANANAYYDLAESVDFDYSKLLAEHCQEVEKELGEAKRSFVAANPSYEEMEGIVAGVPRMAHYDVDIDAGSDASEPESAVSFNLTLPNGKQLKQPGNLFFLAETALWGTNDKLTAKGVEPDVDCDGEIEFGEGLPDAPTFKATLDEFAKQAKSLDEDAQEFEPTPSDAFTSIVVMTPTMSEYFGAWKNSRFVAGANAKEASFVGTSRLSDITDILSGLERVYAGVRPMSRARPAGRRRRRAAA
jgi:Imelysin